MFPPDRVIAPITVWLACTTSGWPTMGEKRENEHCYNADQGATFGVTRAVVPILLYTGESTCNELGASSIPQVVIDHRIRTI